MIAPSSRRLSPTMVAALLRAPAGTEPMARKPWSVREGTSLALESRALVETEFRHSRERVGETGVYWRRTIAGDAVALVLELERLRAELAGLEPETPEHRATLDRVAVLVRERAEGRHRELELEGASS